MVLQWCALFVATVVGVYSAGTSKLPDSFVLCKNNEEIVTCLPGAINFSFKELRDPGIPSIGVPSMDPLKIPFVEIGQGQGPISINIKFSDIIITGLSEAKVLKSEDVDLKATKLIFSGVVDEAQLVADYELTGRILLLPVNGKGRCKLIIKNLAAISGPRGKIIQKKGKDYFNVTDYSLELKSVEKLIVNFENLFNGDKKLGESMNALMNENWKDLWDVLEPPFKETFKAVFLQFSKRIFDKVPFKDIFLDA